VVVGKYLAAVAIYTVSLLFSMFAIYLVFSWGLGTPDGGLFVGTYVGYWFIGLAMLSIGMVASFLTNNLTVGFIVGMIFNMPLALFGVADWILPESIAAPIKRWSAVEQFADFQRGVISLSGISYFVLIAIVMLYISMVLIGRRHWHGREDGGSMWGHYTVRALSLLGVIVGINLFLSNHNSLHVDITSEKLNSLSESTVKLVRDLRNNPKINMIRIDAYVSPQVPADYAAHKLNLLSTLSELSALSGGKIVVDVHQIEDYSEDATLAERTYGIEPHDVTALDQGARTRKEIYLGAAFTCGLDKVVIPFIDKGIPIEYELVRSICTVAQQERKKLGILKTDAQLFGGFSMQGQTEESQIVTELKKQYDVSEVDPSKPIDKRYDVLLAVQPSSLNPASMENFIAAVKGGQPTAVFEDPFPLPQFWQGVVGTSQPKQPPGGMMGMFGGGGQAEPKGDINQLWKLLGVQMYGDEVVWQDFNPEPKAGDQITPLWVFIDDGLTAQGAINPFNPHDAISAGMKQVLFLLTGSIRPDPKSKLDFQELAVTGPHTGTLNYGDCIKLLRSGGQLGSQRIATNQPYIVAAHVTGKVAADDDLTVGGAEKGADAVKDKAETAEAKAGPKENNINVVLVADIDWIAPIIFALREMGEKEEMLIDWKFQNVTFVLNMLDSLAGDDRFVAIRKRTRPHRILTNIEEATDDYRKQSLADQTKFINDASQQIDTVKNEFREKTSELENRKDLDPRMKDQMIGMQRIEAERARDVKIASLEKERDKEVKQSERELTAKIRAVQRFYKLCAVILPPIPPILLAFFVYFHRRRAEQEGVDNRRLRYGKKKDAA
jgi:ABC-2 type transport system permease protein